MKTAVTIPAVEGITAQAPERLVMPGLANETAGVTQSMPPAYSVELRDALMARAVAEVEAAAVPALGELAVTDPWTLAEADRHRVALDGTRAETAAAVQALSAADTALSRVPRPMPFLVRALLALVVIMVAVGAGALLGVLMGPSVHEMLLSAYLEETLGVDAPEFGFRLGLMIATGVGVTLFLVQALSVVAGGGRVHWAFKLGMVLADLGVAGAFGVLRLAAAFSWAAVAVTLFEFAIALAVTVLVFAVGSALARGAEHRPAYKAARATRDAARQRLVMAEREHDAAEARCSRAHAAIAAREDAAARRAGHRAVACGAASIGYAQGLSAAVDKAAANDTDDQVSMMLDEHLNRGLASVGNRGAR